MKKAILFLSVLFIAVSCQKYDDSGIKQDIQKLQEEIASIQAWCSDTQSVIDELKQAVNDLNGISYVETFSGSTGSGYNIGLDDGHEITIYNIREGDTGSYLGIVNISGSKVEFVFSDGTSVTLPRLDATLRFETYDKLYVSPDDTVKLILSSEFTEKNFAGIKAELASDLGLEISVVTKADSYDGWEIKALKPEFGEDGEVTKHPAVVIKSTPEKPSDAILTVSIIDNNGQSHTTSATLTSKALEADLIVTGKIFTSEDQSLVEAFAVKDGKYIYVGDKATALTFAGKQTEILNYSGKGLVMPSCGNGHAHYLMAMNTETVGITFKETDSVEKVLADVKAAATKPGVKLVYGFGWNYHSFLEDGMPTIQTLDDISKDIPIFLNDSEGHKALANSICLQRAGILDKQGEYHGDGKEIRGGEIALDENKKPNGLLLEQAGTYVRTFGLDFGPIMTAEKAREDILATQKLMLSEGYTMYQDGWSNYFNEEDYNALLALEDDGELQVNIGLSYEIESWNSSEIGKELEKAYDMKQKFAGSRLSKANWIKLFMDGTVEGGTGFCTQPYPEPEKGYGIVNWEAAEVADITERANAKGLSMHIHTMGDAAVKRAVDAFAKGGKKDMRNTLVHVRNVDNEDYLKMAMNNIYVTSGMLWHHFNPLIGYLIGFIIPENLTVGSYPMKSYFNNNINVSSSTDYPALALSPDDPFGIMEIAVTGVDGNADDEHPMFPWWPEELINREQALKALTINCAKQMFLEKERGSIAKGKYADFIVVDKDVLECDPSTIHEARTQSTWFEGKMVYSL